MDYSVNLGLYLISNWFLDEYVRKRNHWIMSSGDYTVVRKSNNIRVLWCCPFCLKHGLIIVPVYRNILLLKAMWPLFSKLFYLPTKSHNFLHEAQTSGQYCKSAKIFGKKYTVTMETQFVWRPYWICHIFQVSRTHLVISYT